MKKGLNTYKRFMVATMCLTCIAAGIATASFSFSWFTNTNNVTRPVEGHTAGAYFAGGSGKKDDPYIISSPTHLYNLAWLYYIGYFKDEEPYFTISKDIDMNGWTLPPIGTSTHPFNGHLDANSHKISNLKVSNSYDDLKSRKPSNVTEDDWLQKDTSKGYGPTPNVLGMFGYVAKESDGKGTPSIENLYINSEKVNSTTSTALTGIVAGYVDGKLDKIYIDNSTVTVANNTKAVGTLGDETISNISAYTSVGYCTENYRTKYNKYETTLYEPCYVASTSKDSYIPGGGSGQDNDWGGSIDIASFAKRINYIAKSENSGSTPSATSTYTSTSFNAKLYYSKSFDWDTTNKNGQYVALMEGTYMPLNIDLAKATISGSYEGEMGSYYTSGSNKGEPVLDTNTGYIVGKNTNTGSATPRFHNKTFTSGANGIPYSINVTNQGGTISSADADGDGIFDIFSYENISLFYVDTSSSTTYRISDSENSSTTWSNKIGSTSSPETVNTIDVAKCGFGDLESGYYNVKHNFAKMLSDGNTSTILKGSVININGIQIFGGSSNKDILKSTYSNVRIHNQTFDSYEMLQGGFNFELEKSGSIKLVVGPYTSSSTSHIFPSLYKIERSDDLKTISSYKKINAIYSSNGKYYSQYSDNSATIPSDATKIFDITSLYGGGTLKQNGAYYIEIPLDSGDYWFGPDSSENKCPYILYFDIGANAGDGGSSSNEVTRTKVFELLEQITQLFTYPTGVYVADFDNAVLDTKTLCITLGATYSGDAKIDRTKNDIDTTVETNTSNNTGLAYFDPSFEKVTENNAETTSSDVNEGESTVTTKRMTYFDCSSTSLTMFRFSQTSTDGGEYSSITSETQYQAIVTTSDDGTITLGDWEETSDQTVYNDDGTKTDETNGIPSDISSGITQPTDFSTSTNVFNLKLLVNKIDTFSNEYLSNVTLDENKKAKVAGYDLTLENNSTKVTSTDYSVTRNANYSLSINDETIS